MTHYEDDSVQLDDIGITSKNYRKRGDTKCISYSTIHDVERLDSPIGGVEFARTTEIIERHLPPESVVVADIGGGPGRYSLWLAGLGHRVHHRDAVPLGGSSIHGNRREACGG